MTARIDEHAPVSEPDFQVLRSCRHPVGYADTFERQPRRVTLLGEDLVVWRDSEGDAHVLRDLCTRRSRSVVSSTIRSCAPTTAGDSLRTGAAPVPQLVDPTRVPGKARVSAFASCERYGLLWAAMGEPRWNCRDLPEFASPGWTVVQAGPYRWHADASRQLENFTDFGHFAWVHPGLLGDPDRPVVPRHTVDTDGHILRYEVIRPEAVNTDDFPVFHNPNEESPERHSRYELGSRTRS